MKDAGWFFVFNRDEVEKDFIYILTSENERV